MADLDIHLSALDKCRTAIRKAGGQYDDTLKESNPGKLLYDDNGDLRNNRVPIGGELFGELKDSAGLAAEATGVWSSVVSEMDHARNKLAGAERGLSDVEENIRKAHKATS
ncbi:hypothetical protein SAMN05444920_11350 [Nonomuraea solani]|uniref:Uncharacterized protein n=1 Tax=Nonomuraea solani TaxID=1144553 RepID=A0A1H6ENL6_9ACTN|nr:hypothetical protein [Nonomuraea solani]SEG99448.1 hypothetical protein SAMN05444920_11350 [Nonomuraea solani]